ncbi:hypothetical protein AB0F91_19230 [Amycolatopsis sp. NPDC023774]|uniref:hypothetical protein n=1 Tax=Amycolatopsis sp. NPDC023774 TaxID=3155015 RepID=UPI0033CC6C03
MGERDRIVAATDVEHLVGALEHGTAVVLPGVGHVVPQAAAAQVVPRIVAPVGAAYRQYRSS